MKKIRTLVVDDSAYSRQTIKKMLESLPSVEVAGVASDGIDAIAKTLRQKPDLITLDLEMPEMDGFSFLRWVMMERPTPVIVVSSYSDNNTVFRALELGAADFIAKPSKKASAELKNIEKDLLVKVGAIRELNLDVLSRNLKLLEPPEEEKRVEPAEAAMDAVFIGSSTGGPAALQIILTKLPEDFPAAILVSQHMPRGFTSPLAERLDKISKVRISEAQDGEEVLPGRVLISPGGSHMLVKRRGGKVRVVLKDAEFEDRYVPSIDLMMDSAAQVYGPRAMGIILTGMGNDGRRGMLEIKSKGGYTIAESRETAVVFGMPHEAINAGAALKVLPLMEITPEIINVVRSGA
jgi:two-component system chemotaxis response regulator CheB